jgi:asparagine synthase (glutamine-hydrolysing)
MCGVNGRFNFDGRPVTREEVVAMRDVMVHRGPDGQGLFLDGPIGLGHRRLSIIDLAGGHQPLANEDGTVTIVFNGEIYNFREIRPELEARGHVFATKSDTEVIVHLYEEMGAACVERLRGMFTFAIWDARKRQVLIARDRLGIKPLYYLETAGSLLFASEIKSLLQANGVGAEIDPQGLRRFLVYRHPYGHGTLFKGIRQLPPGHVLIANASGTTVRRYWDVPPQTKEAGGRCSADEFLALLDQAVELRMISDVPLGAFLSGGIDSSAVTALMARHSDRVRTFSIGFVPGEENELSWAKLVADHCRAEHHEFVLKSADFFTLMQKLVWHNDEPMMFPASIPQYLLSKASKAVATVMLAGEGADEILAGYDTNVRTYWINRFASALPRSAWPWMGRLPLPGRVSSVAARMALPETELITGTYRLAGHAGIVDACRLALPPSADDDDAMRHEVGLDSRTGTFLDRFLYFQLKTYLVSLLMKQDKMSMAASIETRVPFLDHHLVGMAFSMSDDQKVRGRRGKHLLKQACAGLLPHKVIYRAKRGFPVPISQWLREPNNPFIDVLLDSGSLRDGLLDASYVRRRVEQFRGGAEISMELWAMLNLELWRREFLTGANRMRAVAS